MENKEGCSNCQTMKEQVEESKRKHLLDFRTIKQKIVSTDELIKLYQKKCQEYDKQTKFVAELTTKLEASQRNMDVVRIQLEKSLEINEPLKKEYNQLEKENKFTRIEMQKLQDRVRGSESLVSQFQSIIKEKEKSEGSCRLDVTIQGQEIEEQKKSLKKNETLIKKLKEQLLVEKNGKKEINKQLSSSLNQLKKKDKQVGDSQQVITKLTQQLKEATQEITGLNKRLKEKIHSPSPSKHGRTTRKTIALEKQENAAVEKSSEMLMDEIMDSLNFSSYTLSPLPPSTSFTEEDSNSDSDSCDNDDVGDVDNDELGNDDPDYIDKDNDDDRQCVRDNLRSEINEKSENEKSECSTSESSCSMPGPLRANITNSASKTDRECSPVQKTNSTNTLDKDNDVVTERTSFSMSLRSKTNRKRKRVSSEFQMCSQMSEVDEEDGVLKTKTLADERSCEERETKMAKHGPETDLITISEIDNDKTNSLKPSSSFDESTILATSKSLTDSRLKPTEEEEPEVSACLKSIVEAVELQESRTINVQTLVEHDKSFVKTDFKTNLETIHKETTSVDEDVLDCLKSIIENISRNEQAIVSDYSEVCNDIVAMNSLDRTTVPIGAGIMDVHQETSDIPCDEAVQSSTSICEQTHKNVHKNRIFKGQKKTQKSDSCFDTRKSLGKTDKGLVVSGTPKNTSSKAEGDLKEYTEDITNAVLSNQDADKAQDSLAESHLNRSLTLSPHLSAPLSPIPDSPERSTPRTEIPSFAALDDLPPLSPIPPSPKELSELVEPEDEGGSDMTPDELELKKPAEMFPGSTVITFSEEANSSSSAVTPTKQLSMDEVNVAGKMIEVEADGKINTPFNKTPAIKSYLDRPAKMNEYGYVLRLLTKVKKGKITTDAATKRFAMITNLRASSPFVSALLQILKLTPDTVKEELTKKYTEQYEGVCDGEVFHKVWKPVITEFEMCVAVVVRELSKLEQFQALFGCLLSLLGKTMFGFFRSGDRASAVLAICRMYTTVCRLMGDGGRVRLLCFDIMKENQRYLLTNEIIMSVGLVWPQVLRFKAERASSLLPGKSITHGLPYRPFLSTLQVITMSRETSSEYEQSTLVFQRLCGWSKMPCGREALELLASELVRQLGESSNVATQDTASDFGPSMGSGAFETVKSLELLSVVMGWEWTNDVLVRDQLWPILEEWKRGELCRESDAVVGSHELSRETSGQKSETFVGQETTKVKDWSQTTVVYSPSENGASRDVDMDVETSLQAADMSKELSDCVDGRNASGFHLKDGNPSKDSYINGRSNNGFDDKEKGLGVLGVHPKMEERIAFQTTYVGSKNARVVMDATMQVVRMGDKRESNVEKNNMEATVVSILRLLGLLGLVGFQQLEVNLDAVVNLMCAVMSCVDKPKRVTFAIQLAAAYAALDLFKANPTKILKVLNEWSARVEGNTNGKNLPSHFTKQLEHFRTYLFGKKPR